jgi:hypothetical protein
MNGEVLVYGLASLGLFILMLPFISAVFDSVMPMYNINIMLVASFLIPVLFIIFLVKVFIDAM